jgi:phosphate transport system substrate-binding protein
MSVALSIGLVTSTTPALAATSISGKGSSFAFSALSACSAGYTKDSVSYTSTGSGTGRTEFASKNIDWAATDTPYTSNYPNFDYVTVPLFGGPIVFAYSATGVPDGLSITPKVISSIFKGKITKWNDPSIVKANPRIKLPNKTIKVAYRASGSGTTANLTNYLSQTVGGWTAGSNDLVTAAGSGFNSNSTSFANSQLLAGYIEDNTNVLGYFDLADAITADVSIAKLQNAEGKFVMPTASAAARFINSQYVNTKGVINLNFKKIVPGAYQLSIVTYGLAPKKSSNTKALAVKNWLAYVVSSCMPSKAARLGYVPIGGSVKIKALNIIKTIG